jgi:ATP-dependent protease HslVU (ClpYQ) peptidase subunit
MTTIASVQGEGWSVIGYDSRVTEEDGRTYTLPKESGKVFKVGNYILGVAGDMRAINLLTHVFKPPACTATTLGVKLDKFMTSVFIPELKKCFEESSYSKDGDQDSQIMVLINGSAYEIGEDYSWCHDTAGVYAIGSGSDFALGSLNALLEGKKRTLTSARATIKTALAVSSKFDNKTSEPFYLLTQYRA